MQPAASKNTPHNALPPAAQKRALSTLFFIAFINLVGFGIVIPLLPFYGRAFEASATEVTILFSAYSLGMFISEPLWGRLSDRIGRKPVLMMTLAGNVLSYAVLAFAQSYEMVLLVRFAAGALGGNISTCQAYVADVTPPDMRARRMGLIGAAFGIGFTLGPAVGGLLAHGREGLEAFMVPMLAASAMSALALLGTLLFLRESNQHMHEARDLSLPKITSLGIVKRPVVGRVLFGTLMMAAGFSGMESTFGLWAEDHLGLGVSRVGLIFAYIGILVAFSQAVIVGRVVSALGERNTLLAGYGIMATSLATLPLSPNVWVQFIPTGGIAIGMALASPTVNAILSKASANHEQGRVIGLNMATSAFSRIFGPILAGFVYATLGPGSSFLTSAALMCAAFCVALGISHHLRTGEDI